MAVSMNGIAEAARSGVKTGWRRGSRGAMALGQRAIRNSARRWGTFEKMAANQGYWKAFQTQVQDKVITGAAYGAMAGAAANTGQYLYANSDRPSVGGAAGAAFRGAVGGGALGGAIGGIGHFTGNPLRGNFRTRAQAAARQAVGAAAPAASARGGGGIVGSARQRGRLSKWAARTFGKQEGFIGPQAPMGPFPAEVRSGMAPGPMGGTQRPSFLGGSHSPPRPLLGGAPAGGGGRPSFLGTPGPSRRARAMGRGGMPMGPTGWSQPRSASVGQHSGEFESLANLIKMQNLSGG